jgi:formate dehydrogenase major subunit
VVDPRFNRSASVADFYAPIRTGSDIVFLGGVINYLLTNDKIQHEYVKNYTDFSFIVREDFAFDEGLFSGYNPKSAPTTRRWDYELGEDGVKVDPTLEHPRCVYQWLKKHYAGYTPEMVESICGTPKENSCTCARSWLRPPKPAVLPPSCTHWAGPSTPRARRFCVPAP